MRDFFDSLKPSVIFGLFVCIVLIDTACAIWLISLRNQSYIYYQESYDLTKSINKLETQKQLYQAQQAKLVSSGNIQNKAEQMGLRPALPSEQRYISTENHQK